MSAGRRRLGVVPIRWALGLGALATLGLLIYLDDSSMLEDGPPYVDSDGVEYTYEALQDSLSVDRFLIGVLGPASIALGGYGAWRYFRGGIWENVTDDPEPARGLFDPAGSVPVDDIIERVDRERRLGIIALPEPEGTSGTPADDLAKRLSRQHHAFAAVAQTPTMPEGTLETERGAFDQLTVDLEQLAVIYRAVDADPRSRPSPQVQRTVDKLHADVEAGVQAHDALVMAATALYAELAAARRASRQVVDGDTAQQIALTAEALREISGITLRVIGTDSV